MRCFRLPLCVMSMAVMISFVAGAETVTVKKDGSGDFTKIMDAILYSFAEDILVYPGTYEESVNITRNNLTIRSYDGPNLTTIDGHLNASASTVTVQDSIYGIRVAGFRIVHGYYGISLQRHSVAEIANCVVASNSHHGIYVYSYDLPLTTVTICNNVCALNMGAGIYIQEDYQGLPYCTILNNIIIKNSGYGLASDSTSNKERVTVAYTDLYQNTPANYDSHFGGSAIVLGPGMLIGIDPLLIGPNVDDARLQSGSPCKDTGSPSPTSNDPDGTADDMGAFGGPNASTFFESPTDGPIVREVTVSPGSVPQGEVFSIQATVAVR